MVKRLDGMKFGKLYVWSYHGHNKWGNPHWYCECDCGNTCILPTSSLLGGLTRSCGCFRKESEKCRTHGKSLTRLHRIWKNMRTRCNSSDSSKYHRYVGRGISICDEWNDFQVFYDWAMQSGYDPKLTIDRINNDGNYEPSNCRWSTYKEQMNNMCRNVWLTINGVTKTLSQWGEIVGQPCSKISYRLLHGWQPEEAVFSTLVRKQKIEKE